MRAVGETIERMAGARGVSLGALSRLLGRNDAYLQQFIRRGTPRRLAEDDRRTLARFFGIDEALLGGAPSDDVVVPYLAIAASAGPGAAVADEQMIRAETFSRAMLRDAGVTADAASLIDVRGDSMAPGIRAGDRLLVDRADRAVPRGGAIFVLRRAGELLVKRLRPAPGGWHVASDNPDWPTIRCATREIDVVGRAKLLLRVPE